MTLIWSLSGFPNPKVLAVVIMTWGVRRERGFHLICSRDLRVSLSV